MQERQNVNNISRHQEVVLSFLNLPCYSHFSCLENFKRLFWKIMTFAVVTLFFWRSDICGPTQVLQFRLCQVYVHSVPPCNSRIYDLRDYHTLVEPQCHFGQKSPSPVNNCLTRPHKAFSPLFTCAIICAFHIILSSRMMSEYLTYFDRFSFTPWYSNPITPSVFFFWWRVTLLFFQDIYRHSFDLTPAIYDPETSLDQICNYA